MRQTTGMLYVLEKGDTVHTVADLAGKTIVTAGQGATPEYVTRYILDTAQVEAQLPQATTGVFQGLLLFWVLACDFLLKYRVRLLRTTTRGAAA